MYTISYEPLNNTAEGLISMAITEAELTNDPLFAEVLRTGTSDSNVVTFQGNFELESGLIDSLLKLLAGCDGIIRSNQLPNVVIKYEAKYQSADDLAKLFLYPWAEVTAVNGYVVIPMEYNILYPDMGQTAVDIFSQNDVPAKGKQIGAA